MPDGALSATICRYRGMDDPSLRHDGALAMRSTVSDAPTLQVLAAELNALPPQPAGTAACPMDDDSVVVLTFHYAGIADDPVVVRLRGCSNATNGRVRSAVPGATVTELQSLTGCPHGGFCNDALRPPGSAASGYVSLCGGPAPGGCRSATIGFCTASRGCMTSDRVVALDAHHRVAARAALSHARYSLRLAPGRYTLALLADGRRARGVVLQRRPVTVVAHTTSVLAFVFQVP